MMNTKLTFKRRCGKASNALSETNERRGCLVDNCPDVWELSNGDFAVIGKRKTNEFMELLPESAGCGPDEEIVLVPRAVMANAKEDLPNAK